MESLVAFKNSLTLGEFKTLYYAAKIVQLNEAIARLTGPQTAQNKMNALGRNSVPKSANKKKVSLLRIAMIPIKAKLHKLCQRPLAKSWGTIMRLAEFRDLTLASFSAMQTFKHVNSSDYFCKGFWMNMKFSDAITHARVRWALLIPFYVKVAKDFLFQEIEGVRNIIPVTCVTHSEEYLFAVPASMLESTVNFGIDPDVVIKFANNLSRGHLLQIATYVPVDMLRECYDFRMQRAGIVHDSMCRDLISLAVQVCKVANIILVKQGMDALPSPPMNMNIFGQGSPYWRANSLLMSTNRAVHNHFFPRPAGPVTRQSRSSAAQFEYISPFGDETAYNEVLGDLANVAFGEAVPIPEPKRRLILKPTKTDSTIVEAKDEVAHDKEVSDKSTHYEKTYEGIEDPNSGEQEMEEGEEDPDYEKQQEEIENASIFEALMSK